MEEFYAEGDQVGQMSWVFFFGTLIGWPLVGNEGMKLDMVVSWGFIILIPLLKINQLRISDFHASQKEGVHDSVFSRRVLLDLQSPLVLKSQLILRGNVYFGSGKGYWNRWSEMFFTRIYKNDMCFSLFFMNRMWEDKILQNLLLWCLWQNNLPTDQRI